MNNTNTSNNSIGLPIMLFVFIILAVVFFFVINDKKNKEYHEVVIKDEAGNVIETIEVGNGETIPIPDVEEKEGYDIVYVIDGQEYSNKESIPKITKDTSVEVKYKEKTPDDNNTGNDDVPTPDEPQTPDTSQTPDEPIIIDRATQICERVKNNSSINYLDFTKELSSIYQNDDYYAIHAAHDCANKYNKPIVVTPNSTFNIYKDDPINEKSPIYVYTNTDLGNSTIYIHDEVYKYNADNNNNIYKIINRDSDRKEIKNTDADFGYYSNYTDIVNNTRNILHWDYAFIRIDTRETNESNQVFKRSGSNENSSGEPKTDSFRVKYNNSSNKMELQNKLFWNKSDYTRNTISKVVIHKIPSDQLVFKNATFKTIINRNNNLCSSKYIQRGIHVMRSNTRIDNITHLYVNVNNQEVNTINYKYNGFFNINNASDVSITNSKVYSLKVDNCSGGNSTYDLTLTSAVSVNVDNVNMYHDSQLTDDLWGVMGSNYSKNLSFNNCKLNRIDAHRGLMVLKVTNSTLGKYGINVTGVGVTDNNKLTVTNTKVIGTSVLVNLRSDYGSTWNGEINVKNCTIQSPNSNGIVVQVVPTVENGKLHNYGYDLYLPNITVDGLTLSSSNPKHVYALRIKDVEYDTYKNMTINNNITGLQTHFNNSITTSRVNVPVTNITSN